MSKTEDKNLEDLKIAINNHLSNSHRSMISHLINNPLCTLMLNLNWLINDGHNLDSNQLSVLEETLREATHIQTIVKTITTKEDPCPNQPTPKPSNSI